MNLRSCYPLDDIHSYANKFALSCSFRMKIDDGTTKSEHWLRDPCKGLYIFQLIWCEMDSFSQGAVYMGLASHRYDEADYYCEYDDSILAARAHPS